MLTFLRWFGRILFLVGVLGLLACGALIAVFNSWKQDKLRELDGGSRIAKTPAGNIEFTQMGDGPPVLVLHGSPGGYDQAALIGGQLVAGGYSVIAPSRPGYLRTPLASGLRFEDQADAMELLLDVLGKDRVAVVGFSAGAQVALQFAIRHPDRTRGLILISPVTKPYLRNEKEEPRQLLSEATLFRTSGDMGAWILVEMAERRPADLLESVLSLDTTLDAAQRHDLADYVVGHPKQLEFFRGLVGSQAPLAPRESGTRNDLVLLRALQPVAYDRIQVPMLVVQGGADQSSPWTDAGVITEAVPDATLHTVEDAGHLVWLGPGADGMNEAIARFLGALPLSSPNSP